MDFAGGIGPFSGKPLPTFENDAERFEWQYNRVLDGMITMLDKWAELSMAVNDGLISVDVLKEKYDLFMAEKGMIVIMLDEIRKRKNADKADKLVEEFRKELSLAPETDEPDYGI